MDPRAFFHLRRMCNSWQVWARVLLDLNQVIDAPIVLDAETTGADVGKGGEVLLAPHAMYLNYIAG